MPLALLVLSTVPVRLSVRNTSCPLHISYTLFFIMWAIMDSLCRVRPTVGRSVRPALLAFAQRAPRRSAIFSTLLERCKDATLV